MRIVLKPSDLVSSVEMARRESQSAFGNDTVYIEKYLEKPRHIEFQILADNYGNVIHLFERECSIQRRYQKIIEESPSIALDTKLRDEMGGIAKKVIATSHYNNAGTVEFLLDANKNFYFLEVNARIQVEHPVTEMVVGIDLVKQQIKIAGGEKLSLQQKDLSQRGHAIECRIYAEDPENNFYPSFGKIGLVKEPVGPGIRCDSGIYSGWEVPLYYDPILSKLIVWDESRERAVNRMTSALSEYAIMGIKTQIQFLREVIQHPEFKKGKLHTHFISEHFGDWKPRQVDDRLMVALIAAAILKMEKPLLSKESALKSSLSPWQLIGRWEFMSSINKYR
jgi:acetyl-CoA carboxylase biotin carboxylase subunit